MASALYRATLGRLFAAGYDGALRATEDAGLRDRRRALLAAARGTTLELGAGTGLNLEHYPARVTALMLAEPSPHMRARLQERVGRSRREADVLDAAAERLPLPDASVDTVVSTLVLCSVRSPAAALAEVARVLRPDGRLLFLEHVRADERGTARLQDAITPLWRLFVDGCHPNRDLLGALERSPLVVEDVRAGQLPKAMALVRPTLEGSARRPAA